MNDGVLLVGGFFLFVMASVSASLYGYFRWLQASSQPAGPAENQASTQELFAQAFRAVGERVPGAKHDTNPTRRLLISAGYRYASAVPIFYGIKIAASGLLAAVLGWTAYLRQGDLTATLTAAAAGAGFGYLTPDRVLKPLIRARMGRIRQAIPPALDLMVLSVEAGQSLNQALLDTATELRDAFPDLASEMTQVHMELRAGRSRADALYDLGDRNTEPELRKLANVLIDADRFGTSLAPALRSHARYLRVRMRQQAQEAARKVGVKLVFPVFFLIFPAVLLVTLAPAVMKMAQQLRSLLDG